MSKKKSQILLLLVCPLLLYFLTISFMPLLEPDESRYSDIPSLMNQTGDYVTPRLHHVVYLEKPPLVYWATALIFKVFGESDFSSRLFVALCAWGCILLVYFMGVRLRDVKTGLYAAGILSTFLFHYLIGKINILDMPLTFFVCLSIWAGYRYLADSARFRIWIYLAYVAAALAVLTKGLIGLAFPFAILGIWLMFQKRWRDLPRLISPIGILAFLAITLPWVILAQKANSDFLRFFFVQEHFLRYTTKMHGRDATFFYYIPVLLLGTLPWCAFLWKASKEGHVGWRGLFKKPDIVFLLVWMLLILLFYSISSSKLIPYIGPVFLPLALLFAQIFRQSEESPESRKGYWLYKLPVIAQSLVFIAVLLAPPFLRNTKLGGDLVIMYSQNWWWLIIIPVIAQILMIFLPDRLEKKWNIRPFATIYVLSAVFFASLIFPASDFLSPYKSARPVAEAIQKIVPADTEVYQYKIALYGVDFYNKIRTPIIDDFGELGFGIAKLSESERKHFFLSSPEFYELVRQKGEIYCITQYRERLHDLKKEIPNLEILWDNDAFFLVRLRPEHEKEVINGNQR